MIEVHVLQFEGEFRTTHTRVSINAEAIAFYNGQERERLHANSRYENQYSTYMRYYIWQGALMFLRLVCIISQPSVGMRQLFQEYFVQTCLGLFTKILKSFKSANCDAQIANWLQVQVI